MPLPRLPALRRRIWRWLAAAPRDLADSWRTAALATADPEGPHVRIVIVRAVRPRLRELEFHTDSRSLKVEQIRKSPDVEWLFYDPAEKLQLRAAGKSTIHIADAVVRAVWEKVPALSRANYLQLCHPGKILGRLRSIRSGLPASSEPHFAVVITRVERFDWLWLHPEGHRRASFKWHRGRWSANWLGP